MSKVQRIIATAFIIIGLILLGVGAYMGIVPAIPKEFVATTQATIVDSTTSYSNTTSNGRRNTTHNVLVEYEIEGKKYERMLGYYNSSMAIGQQEEI
jgi:hypothetical protein